MTSHTECSSTDLRTELSSTERGDVIARVHGIAGILSTHELRTALLDGLDRAARKLMIDLSDVHFIDAVGLAVLVGIDRAARGAGKSLTLLISQPRSAELLRDSGLAGRFTVRDTSRTAVPAQRPVPAAEARTAIVPD